MRNHASIFSMLRILVAMLLLIALNGCAIVVQDKEGVCHHAGIGVGTSPSFCIRIGYWYTIPIDGNACNDCHECLHH